MPKKKKGKKKITAPKIAQPQKIEKEEVLKKKENKESILSKIRLGESYTSLLLGIVVVVLGSFILVGMVGRRPQTEPKKDTSSTKTENIPSVTPAVSPVTGEQPAPAGAISGDSYVLQEGEGLSDVAFKAYGDGDRWPDIARANNISNPDTVNPGTTLKIPR